MSFIAPFAVTGAVSLYVGYKTYKSYYSNCEFEELLEPSEELMKDFPEELMKDFPEELIKDFPEELMKDFQEEPLEELMKDFPEELLEEPLEEIRKIAKEMVNSIIENVVQNMENEQCSEEVIELHSSEEVIELPKTRKELEEVVLKDEKKINKIIEEVKNSENIELTNYDNIVKVINKSLEKMDKKEDNVRVVIDIEVVDVETNNENVVEEIVKSPIQISRNQNNLKKRKKKKNKKNN